MKSIKIFFLFLILLSLYSKSKVSSQSSDNELLKLIEIAHKEKININSWKMYIMKPVEDVDSEKELKNQIEKIKTSEEGYTWDNKPDENKEHHFTAVGYKQIESKDIGIRVKVNALPVGNKYRIYHSYEIIGNDWSKDIWKYIYTNFNNEIHGQNVFYTLKGTLKNSLDFRKQGDLLLRKLSGIFVEGMIEDNFISLSAYTELWDSYILVENNKKINLQIGLRKNKDNLIDVTIGTPIITTEY